MKVKGPMASLKIPQRLFWFPLWGTSRYYLLPNSLFLRSCKMWEVKKKKNQQHQQLQKLLQQPEHKEFEF